MILHKVKTIHFESGEEFRMLIDKDTLEPMLEANLYAVRKLRNKGDAANTIGSKLKSISLMYAWLDERPDEERIDLKARFAKREYLSEHEIYSLASFCEINFNVRKSSTITRIKPRKVVKPTSRKIISKMRIIEIPSVAIDTRYTRITNIADYLKWLAIHMANNIQQRITRETRDEIKDMYERLVSERPGRKKRARLEPKSLTEEEQEEVKKIFEIGVEINPSRETSVQVRNKVLFSLLYHLGIRIGELLGIKIGDIDFRKNIITIHRRPDDVEDVRASKPQTKTNARDLPINKSLAVMIQQYIVRYRSKVKNNSNIPFLLISHHASRTPIGSALSKSSVNKLFTNVRNSSSKLKEFHPHMLRHTWNINFSEWLDGLPNEDKYSESEELAIRNLLQGWDEESKMGIHYNNRHIKKKATKASLDHQNKLIPEAVKKRKENSGR